MTAKKNRVGLRYGRLVVVSEAPKTGTKIKWLCKCDCRKEKAISASNLETGHTLSCGCITSELQSNRRDNWWKWAANDNGEWIRVAA